MIIGFDSDRWTSGIIHALTRTPRDARDEIREKPVASVGKQAIRLGGPVCRTWSYGELSRFCPIGQNAGFLQTAGPADFRMPLCRGDRTGMRIGAYRWHM